VQSFLRRTNNIKGSPHQTSQIVRVGQFLQDHQKVQFHFTPAYSAWLKQIEFWFAKIQRDIIGRGVFTSVADQARKLCRYIRAYEKQARPFRWTYTNPQRRIHTNSITGAAHQRPWKPRSLCRDTESENSGLFQKVSATNHLMIPSSGRGIGRNGKSCRNPNSASLFVVMNASHCSTTSPVAPSRMYFFG
jgi:hypothetical protein